MVSFEDDDDVEPFTKVRHACSRLEYSHVPPCLLRMRPAALALIRLA